MIKKIIHKIKWQTIEGFHVKASCISLCNHMSVNQLHKTRYSRFVSGDAHTQWKYVTCKRCLKMRRDK